MPMLKAISGHTSVKGIRRYLTKKNRALAEDHINLDPPAPGAALDWAAAMDATRRLYGNDSAWRGRRARTYKHYVVSPDPKDRVSLEGLRALAAEWARESFPNHEVAIVYHDDNANGIPHAHVVVNNTDLETGRRLQDPDPKALARSLQRIAGDLGMSALEPRAPLRRRRPRAAPARAARAEDASRRARPARREGARRPRGVLLGGRHPRPREGGALRLPQRRRVQKPPLVHGGGGFRQLAQSREEGLGLFPRRGRLPARWAGKGSVCRTAGAGSSRCCSRAAWGACRMAAKGRSPLRRARRWQVGDLAELKDALRGGRGSRSRRARRASTTWTPRRRTGARPPSPPTRGASACSPGSAPLPVGASPRRSRRSGTARRAPKGTTPPPPPEAGTGGKGGSGDDR